MGSRVELFAAIRRDERVEELSIRQLAEDVIAPRAAAPPARTQFPTRAC